MMRSLLIIMIVVMGTLGRATPPSGAYVPGFQLTMPSYFSGTNCYIQGEVFVHDDGHYLVSSKLYVNNHLVNELYWHGDPEPKYLGMHLSAKFDSTHFPNQSTVTIKIVGQDESGNTYTGTGTATTKNSMLFTWTATAPQNGDSVPFDPIDIAEQEMSGTNYGQNTCFGNDWDPDDFLNAMDGNSTIFVADHGAPNLFLAGKTYDHNGVTIYTSVVPYGNPLYDNYGNGWLIRDGVESFRMSQIGSGLPPFYSTGSPPINFAFLESCSSGSVNDFVRFSYPYEDDYGNWMVDQAFTGFACHILLSDMELISRKMFVRLSVGQVLVKARAAVESSSAINFDTGQPISDADMPIWGDKNMRLKYIYTGDDTSPSGWFRAL